MRLRRTNVTTVASVTSDDGKATLTYMGSSNSRDLMGSKFILEVDEPELEGGKIIMNTIIGFNGISGIIQAAKLEGLDYDEMDIVEAGEFGRRYFQTHPSSSYLNWYEFEPATISKEKKIELRKILVSLFFKVSASFEHNNSDKNANPHEYYQDIFYCPLFGNEPVEECTFYAPKGAAQGPALLNIPIRWRKFLLRNSGLLSHLKMVCPNFPAAK